MISDKSWRYSTLVILLSFAGIYVIYRLVWIQMSPQAKIYQSLGSAHSCEWKTIVPTRGEILDRWGHLLAGNTKVYEVGAELAEVKNPSAIALALNAVVGADYNQVFAAVNQLPSQKAVYVVLANNVTEEQKARLEQLSGEIEAAYGNVNEGDAPSLAGLRFIPKLKRSYPESELASNILGFVNYDGEGIFGVEEKFNGQLAGIPKKVCVPLDPNRVTELPQVPEGASITLTIDRALQAEIQGILYQALSDSGAENGTIVVMDPRTNEIMAMATTPLINLNEFWRLGEVFVDTTPFNPAVSKPYEPGSVFKVLTMSAALDSGVVQPSTPFLDTGVFEIGGVVIRNWNGGAWGPQDMIGCMQHSLNVCLAWVASQLGANRFYSYLKNFGIGQLTGIELAGEAPGRLKQPGDSDWYEADLGTNAFGQGISATPIQMVMAASALANEGKMMTPRIVYSINDRGREYLMPTRVAGMPISAEAARTITEMLATSLEVESSDALVPGYRVAGKTGTAEIPTPYGYTTYETNASFVGWGPTDDPRFLVYIWLEKPTVSPWGSVVAAPVFRQVVEHLVVYLNLPPDDIRKSLAMSH